jgi:hypothetical protein
MTSTVRGSDVTHQATDSLGVVDRGPWSRENGAHGVSRLGLATQLTIGAVVVAAGSAILRGHPDWSDQGALLVIAGGLSMVANFGRAIEKGLTDLALIKRELERLIETATQQ